MSAVLNITGLKVAVKDNPVLNGVDLTIEPASVHAIMGPNGSGKSTLAMTLGGREDAEIIAGEILYKGDNLFTLAPEERAQLGLFIGFQYPVDLPGVRLMSFFQAAVNARRKGQGKDALNPAEFLRLVREKAATLDIDEEMLRREVNVGFSGGERKRFEALQMILLEPDLAILDEIDSGLDIDALKLVARAAQSLRDAGKSVLMITHYQRILDHIRPDKIHILQEGRIARSGDSSLAKEVERVGYVGAAAK